MGKLILQGWRRGMRWIGVLSGVIGLAGCAPLNEIGRASRTDIAVVTADYTQRPNGPFTLRLEAGQRLRAARVNGQDGWCSTTPVFIPDGWVLQGPMGACFIDSNNRGRLETMVAYTHPFQRGTLSVNIPYMLEPAR